MSECESWKSNLTLDVVKFIKNYFFSNIDDWSIDYLSINHPWHKKKPNEIKWNEFTVRNTKYYISEYTTNQTNFQNPLLFIYVNFFFHNWFWFSFVFCYWTSIIGYDDDDDVSVYLNQNFGHVFFLHNLIHRDRNVQSSRMGCIFFFFKYHIYTKSLPKLFFLYIWIFSSNQ